MLFKIKKNKIKQSVHCIACKYIDTTFYIVFFFLAIFVSFVQSTSGWKLQLG